MRRVKRATNELPPPPPPQLSTMRAAVLVLLVGAASSFVEQSEWSAFKLKHAKSYANPIEEFYRMKVFAVSQCCISRLP